MKISVSEAKAQLTDLVRRAEAGEEVVLTRHGQAAVSLVPTKPKGASKEQKRALLEALRGKARGTFGADAAHAADFLYDDHGLPA